MSDEIGKHEYRRVMYDVLGVLVYYFVASRLGVVLLLCILVLMLMLFVHALTQ
jgi:hypothetical protein